MSEISGAYCRIPLVAANLGLKLDQLGGVKLSAAADATVIGVETDEFAIHLRGS